MQDDDGEGGVQRPATPESDWRDTRVYVCVCGGGGAGYLGRRDEELWIQRMSRVLGQLRDSLFGLLGEESNQLLIRQGLRFWKCQLHQTILHIQGSQLHSRESKRRGDCMPVHVAYAQLTVSP